MTTVSQTIREQEGERLMAAYKRARLSKRINQSDIAAACGWVSSSSANRVLNGKVALTLETLMCLSELFGVEPATISPRLAHIASNALPNLRALTLPVSSVTSLSRGLWGEPFRTTKQLPFLTADDGSYALMFDDETSPLPIADHIAVIEPARKAGEGDYVVVKQGTGRYCFGKVTSTVMDTSLAVQVENKGEVLAKARQCSVVVAFCNRAMLKV